MSASDKSLHVSSKKKGRDGFMWKVIETNSGKRRWARVNSALPNAKCIKLGEPIFVNKRRTLLGYPLCVQLKSNPVFDVKRCSSQSRGACILPGKRTQLQK